METIKNKAQKIVTILLKDLRSHTATSLSKELKVSRWGVWKILKKLEKDQLIILESIGTGRTSTQRIKLNWGNILVEKTLALSLTQEALGYKRWRFNFKKLEKKIDFLILFGSILHSPKEADDIDVLVVTEKKNLIHVGELIIKIQVSQEKDMDSPTTKTLAIIAYKSPVTQSEIIKIRGNKAYDHISNLKESGLISSEKQGRTRLIKLSPHFFDYFDIAEKELKESLKTPIDNQIQENLQDLPKPNEN